MVRQGSKVRRNELGVSFSSEGDTKLPLTETDVRSFKGFPGLARSPRLLEESCMKPNQRALASRDHSYPQL